MAFQDINQLRNAHSFNEAQEKIAQIVKAPDAAIENAEKHVVGIDGADYTVYELDEEPNMYNNSCFGKLAGHPLFESITLSIIVINALYMGVDIEYDSRWGKPKGLYNNHAIFISFELFFCVFFVFELVTRFIGYRAKCNIFCDGWFMFDFGLVCLMILETTVLPFVTANLPNLGVLRLLRLLRIARMAKLLRTVPELMTIVQGLAKSVRAVGSSAVLLLLATYVVAIIFTQRFHAGPAEFVKNTTDDSAGHWFGGIDRSMYSLLVMGAIFDDLTMVSDTIKADTASDLSSWLYQFIFIAYMVLAGFIILNMLIGVLAEVIAATADEQKAASEFSKLVFNIGMVLKEMDRDNDRCISKSEFFQMRTHDAVKQALNSLGIDRETFFKVGEYIFSPFRLPTVGELADESETVVEYKCLASLIYRLRPDTELSAIDFASFDSDVTNTLRSLRRHSDEVLRRATALASATPLSESDIHQMQQWDSTASLGTSKRSKGTRTIPLNNKVPPSSKSDGRWGQVSTEQLLAEVQRRIMNTDQAAKSEDDLRRSVGDHFSSPDTAVRMLGSPPICSPFSDTSMSAKTSPNGKIVWDIQSF